MTTHLRTRNITLSVYALAQASSRLARRGRWIALCLALAFTLCAASISATAQTNYWTWMGGSNGGSKVSGVYGTLEVPAVSNMPGSRDSAVGWTDGGGNLWLFGGYGVDDEGNLGYLNDQWRFSPSTLEWEWMGGGNNVASHCEDPGVCGPPGVYGQPRTPALGNIPGGREGASNWTDSSGNLWLFGGDGFDDVGNWGALNDLWKFFPSTNEWAVMAGGNVQGEYGVYGTLRVPANGNTPGGREYAASWIDSSGHLWLFGGNGFAAQSPGGDLNDLWEFNPSTNEWAWMGGSNTVGSNGGNPGVYGTLGTPAAGNIPGGRESAARWTDTSGNLWLFGGDGYDINDDFGILNDLWKFNPSTNEWTWMGGSSSCHNLNTCTGIAGGVYGTLGVAAAGNIPGGRDFETSWTDSSGNFWLFGGYGFDINANLCLLNDLWMFKPSTNQWTWMGGSNSCSNVTGVYGTLGTPSSANMPGGRDAEVAWTDDSGNFWLFGGLTNSNGADFNDLWKFGPATLAVTPTFSPAGGSYDPPLTVTISDATPGATIHYTTDGTQPTIYSTAYSGSITVAASETVQAIAAEAGYVTSAVGSATYIFPPPAPTPTFSPAGESSGPPLIVTISDAVPGATIHYTITPYGSTPTTPTTSSTQYSASTPITVAASETVQAIATATGYSPSAVGSATYIINGQVATPTFSPSLLNINPTQTVTISDATSGAAIYYNINAQTAPTTSSSLYSSSTPIAVPASVLKATFQAIAVETGYTNSAVGKRTYTILPSGNIITQVGNVNGTAGYSGDGEAATSAELNAPFGAVVDSSGNLYIADADNNCIRKVTASTGIITTVAGNGTEGYSGDGGAATSAELDTPTGVAVDTSGNLYIVDLNNDLIRKVTASTGIITTVAGNGTLGYSGDGGAATSAELNSPFGVAVDASGNIYIADSGNNNIRKVTASTGIITTVAGNGTGGYSGDSGVATSAELNSPFGVAVDASSNLYIADSGNNRIRKVAASTGIITTTAGNGTAGYSGDSGAATSAALYSPFGVAVDASGNIYIADTYNLVIRTVTASTGIITTVAGNGTAGSTGDGGAASSAELSYPTGVVVDSLGNFYIADYNNNKVRTVGSITK
jgi:N-acetylneuraminic acid mutarotase